MYVFLWLQEALVFVVIVLITLGWHAFCFFYLAPRLLPDAWVERAVAEMGQSMGVTSTGLLLLRMCDPLNDTAALHAFSYKQLLHEPIVGGGIWTAVVLPFINEAGIWPPCGVSGLAVIIWLAVYKFYFAPKYASDVEVGSTRVDMTAPLLSTNKSAGNGYGSGKLEG